MKPPKENPTRRFFRNAEDVPGLGSVTYWVGAVGDSGDLPPSVESRISPFRRTSV